MKIKILRNLGLKPDGTPWPPSPDGDPYHEGEEADLDDGLTNALLGAGLAEPVSMKTVAEPELRTIPRAEPAPSAHQETARRGRPSSGT